MNMSKTPNPRAAWMEYRAKLPSSIFGNGTATEDDEKFEMALAQLTHVSVEAFPSDIVHKRDTDYFNDVLEVITLAKNSTDNSEVSKYIGDGRTLMAVHKSGTVQGELGTWTLFQKAFKKRPIKLHYSHSATFDKWIDTFQLQAALKY